MIGGVCEAFGRATFLPAWMWRVGFCAAVLIWGTGIAAYLVLMLSIPDERKSAEQGARANAGICHAACDRRYCKVKNRNPVSIEARGAPAPVVAHL